MVFLRRQTREALHIRTRMYPFNPFFINADSHLVLNEAVSDKWIPRHEEYAKGGDSAEEPQKHVDILSLPDEIIQSIIEPMNPEELYVLSNVNKRLRANAQAVFGMNKYQALYRKQFNIIANKPLDMIERFFRVFGDSITVWDTGCAPSPDVVNGFIVDYCKNIREFHGTINSAAAVRDIKPLSTRAESLHVMANPWRYDLLRISDFIAAKSTVKVLGIAGSFISLQGSAVRMPQLSELHLANVCVNGDLVDFLRVNQQLTVLTMRNVHFRFYFHDLLEVLPNLRFLRVWCPDVEVDFFDHVGLRNLRHLETLQISLRNDQLTAMLLAAVKALGAPLQSLSVSYELREIQRIIRQLPFIKTLMLVPVSDRYRELSNIAKSLVHMERIDVVETSINQCMELLHKVHDNLKEISVSIVRHADDTNPNEFMRKLSRLKALADKRKTIFKVVHIAYHEIDNMVCIRFVSSIIQAFEWRYLSLVSAWSILYSVQRNRYTNRAFTSLFSGNGRILGTEFIMAQQRKTGTSTLSRCSSI